MYLSRLILNPRSRRVQSEAASPYELHRTVMRAFPDHLQPGKERVLYRLDQSRRGLVLSLLVQSLHPPDWSWLDDPGARGMLAPSEGPNPEVKPFHPAFHRGQVLVFRLRANPTVKRSVGDGRKVRCGLYKREEQRAWLERKAEQGGFALLRLETRQEGIRKALIHREEESHALKLLSVRYDGLLRVTDPERLLETLKCGIGSGKGLGFGLLSLARPVR